MQSHNTQARGLWWKVALPIAIGIGVVVWLFLREFDPNDLDKVRWSQTLMWALLMAVLATAFRELGFMCRFRVLSDRFFTWAQAFKLTMLCEFTSCITPTTVGGSAMSVVFMAREGLSAGRSSVLMLTATFLDELFFVIAVPVMLLLLPGREVFGIPDNSFTLGLRTTFWIAYGGICLLTVMLWVGIFVRPGVIAALLRRMGRWPLLRRWLEAFERTAADLIEASHDLSHRSFRWWLAAFGATALQWTARYLVVNALFYGFVGMANQGVIFGRQIVIWTVLSVTPTPGGSGVSEWLFTNFYGDMIHDVSVALVIALFWRLLTYYWFLIAGVFTVPGWLRQHKSAKNSKYSA